MSLFLAVIMNAFASSDSGVIQEPSNCLSRMGESFEGPSCGFRFTRLNFLKLGKLQIGGNPGTSLMIQEGRLRLLEGRAYLIAKDKQDLQLPGRRLSFLGQLVVSGEQVDRVTVENIRATLDDEMLLPGLSRWFGVSPNSRFESGLPIQFQADQAFTRSMRLCPDPAACIEAFKELAESSRARMEATAEFYKEVAVNRTIAREKE